MTLNLKPFLGLAALLALGGASEARAEQYLVPEDFQSIQAAVDVAQDGDEIFLADGVFQEQIVIRGVELTIIGEPGARLVAPPGLQGGIIEVREGGALQLFDTIVDGANNGVAAGFFGVYASGSSLMLENVEFRGLDLPGCADCQTGIGVLAETDPEGRGSAVDISGSIFAEYQKGGVVVRGEGSLARIGYSTFDGRGGSDVIARNGVQIDQGASGEVVRSVFKNHFYARSGWLAAGVVLVQTENVLIKGNRFIDNQVGVYNVTASDVWIQRNMFLSPGGYENDYGIVLRPFEAPYTEEGVKITRNLLVNQHLGIYIAEGDEGAMVTRNVLVNSPYYSESPTSRFWRNWGEVTAVDTDDAPEARQAMPKPQGEVQLY